MSVKALQINWQKSDHCKGSLRTCVNKSIHHCNIINIIKGIKHVLPYTLTSYQLMSLYSVKPVIRRVPAQLESPIVVTRVPEMLMYRKVHQAVSDFVLQQVAHV